jgi:hypothetical protein
MSMTQMPASRYVLGIQPHYWKAGHARRLIGMTEKYSFWAAILLCGHLPHARDMATI